MPYPWNQTVTNSLQQRELSGKLPHALLLTGIEGLGKEQFAHEFATWLLCTDKQQRACGQCRNCQLIAAGSHPDLKTISLPEDKSQIVVDQIRQLDGYIALTPQIAQRKVAIINTAEKMNNAASNSLLKTLEEPAGDAVIILITSHFSQLIATIRSRCQRVEFPAPETAMAIPWLEKQIEQPEQAELLLNLANGAPLKAAAFAKEGMLNERGELFELLKKLANRKADPVQQAEKWAKKEPRALLFMLASWVSDMLRLKLASESTTINNADQHNSLLNMANHLDSMALYKYHDQVIGLQQQLDRSANVQMLMERLFITWVAMFPRS